MKETSLRVAAVFCYMAVMLLGCVPARAAGEGISLQYEGGYRNGSGVEIVAYDASSKRMYALNAADGRVEVIDIAKPSSPTLLFHVNLSVIGSLNSIAVRDGVVAVAVASRKKTDPGRVVFLDGSSNVIRMVTVGANPDMVTITPDGSSVLVANEGEPGETDPPGTVSIIGLSKGVAQATVKEASFKHFDSSREELRKQGVRIFGRHGRATVSEDLEPEYITVAKNSKVAWVTLQENNAVAVLDIVKGRMVKILPLGFKDHSKYGAGLDPSDKDGGIVIRQHPVFGMYQPDAIACFGVKGKPYFITANEGDTRDHEGESVRVADVRLDPKAFPNASAIQKPESLGRLQITTERGDTDGDGDYDELYCFGARSFSIWTHDGKQVYDSGDEFEQRTAKAVRHLFNSDGNAGSCDSRSDNKGPEPEGVTTGVIDGRTYAFIVLERTSGMMVYDVTDPAKSEFVQYVYRNGDKAPESVLFIPASDSPTGKPLVAVANEAPDSVRAITIYRVDSVRKDN